MRLIIVILTWINRKFSLGITAFLPHNYEFNDITTSQLVSTEAPAGQPAISPEPTPPLAEEAGLVEPEQQVRQLIKQALEAPTPQQFVDFFDFTLRFRRLSVWNARMAHIQRPGASAIATENEWRSIKRYVLPDAVPIIILWPFSPIRFVYELADTGPPVDREAIGDPFATPGSFNDKLLSHLVNNLKKQKNFVVEVEFLRQGYDLAGSASFQGTSSPPPSPDWTEQAPNPLGFFASAHTYTRPEAGNARTKAPLYRVLVNDRLLNKERFVTLAHELGHIFCGHLGACLPGNGKDEESGWPDRRNTPLKIREIEAEAVAFLVAGRAGLTPASAAYLRPYAQTVDPGCVEMDLIVRAAGRIERLANAHYGKMQFK